MKAFLEAHPLASLIVMAGTVAVCMFVLLWIDTRDDARHEMDDTQKGGR